MNDKINAAVARWTNPELRPLFKGALIDDDGCCCAQGDILRHECKMSDQQLKEMRQSEADGLVAKELGISRFQAVLLRVVNDCKDGCPQDVLTHPEDVLGKYAQQCLAFGRHLDAMTPEQRAAAGAAAGAMNEIQGQDVIREKGQSFYFLPLFGFATPEDIPAH